MARDLYDDTKRPDNTYDEEYLQSRKDLTFQGWDKDGNAFYTDERERKYYVANGSDQKSGGGSTDNVLRNVVNSDFDNSYSYQMPTYSPPDSVVNNAAPVLSSGRPVERGQSPGSQQIKDKYAVTNKNPVLSSKTGVKDERQTDDSTRTETHFIEKVTGQYLGAAPKEYYDYIKQNGIKDEVITFVDIKINIRSLQNQGSDENNDYQKALYWDNKQFEHMSDPLPFEKDTYNKCFETIVATNVKGEKKEQCLVIVYDDVNKKITAAVLPDRINTVTPTGAYCEAFAACTTFDKQATFLIPPELWEDAMDNYVKLVSEKSTPEEKAQAEKHIDFLHTEARKYKHPVIGFSHTHPDYSAPQQFDGPGTFTTSTHRTYTKTYHSAEDKKIASERRLSDVIITFTRTAVDKIYEIDKIEIMTKDGNYEKVAKDLSEFFRKHNLLLFSKIIKPYTWIRPKK